MPTLNWMGRKNAVKYDKDVVRKILREDRSLSHSEGSRSCATGSAAEMTPDARERVPPAERIWQMIFRQCRRRTLDVVVAHFAALATPDSSATTMVDDVPTESRLHPAGWSRIKIG